MNFSDYSIKEVTDLSASICDYIAKYTKENLQGFTKEQQMIIGTTALSHLLTIVNIDSITSGLMSFETFKKCEDLMIEFVRKKVKGKK